MDIEQTLSYITSVEFYTKMYEVCGSFTNNTTEVAKAAITEVKTQLNARPLISLTITTGCCLTTTGVLLKNAYEQAQMTMNAQNFSEKFAHSTKSLAYTATAGVTGIMTAYLLSSFPLLYKLGEQNTISPEPVQSGNSTANAA